MVSLNCSGCYITSITTAIICLISVWWYFRQYKYIKGLKKFPGPKPLPIIGNVLDFVSSKDLSKQFLKYEAKYGGIVKLHIGIIPNILIVTDLKLLEFLFKSATFLNKSKEYSYLTTWLGKGLLTTEADEKWRKHKKLITPTFYVEILGQFVERFNDINTILIEKLQEELGKSSTDIFPIISSCTLDTICDTAMGISLNAQTNCASEYVNSIKAVCRVAVDRAFNPLLQYKYLYCFTPQYRTEKKAVKFLHDYTNSVIVKRKCELEKSVHDHASKGDAGDRSRKFAFLDLLIEKNKDGVLLDEHIREEVDTFLFAGQDTTATALSFTLFCLANNPEVQDKVVEELNGIFADDGSRPATIKDLQEMKYLDAVIKEALRLYPSVPIIGRQLSDDIEYEGSVLPKGLSTLVHIYSIHRNPEVYPEPLKFIPERFLSDNPTIRSPYAYIPFSAGGRNCIGQKYAMLAIKSTVTKILLHFKLLPASPEHIPEITSEEATLKSKNGVCIRLVERKVQNK